MSTIKETATTIKSGMRLDGQCLCLELFYPRNHRHVNQIEVGLVDVRAADSIRISYDFERDGYCIKQASRFSWPMGDEECNGDWQEVAFVPAWQREESEEEAEARIEKGSRGSSETTANHRVRLGVNESATKGSAASD